MITTGTPSLLRRLDGVAGRVSVPGDAAYDADRLPWQRAVEHRPAVIVTAHDVDDVRAAVLAARDCGVPFAVMGTGHGTVEGLASGVLLRTTELTGVRVDPVAGTVRVGAGETWTAVLDAAEPHGLAPGCGTTGSVGVTGYTLQGGIGWLSREYGTAADDLLEAEVVTADGAIVTTSARENADLWWALRGGGGGFGVVTALTLRLHRVGTVVGGSSLHPIEHGRDVLASYRAWAPDEPREMSTAVQLIAMPDRPGVPQLVRGRCVVAIRAFSTLDEATTRDRLAPLLSAAGPALLDGIAANTLAGMLRVQGPPPAPIACTERVHPCDDLTDGLFEQLVGAVGPGSDGVVACVEVKQWGGAIATHTGAGPTGHRAAAFSVLVAARYDGRHPDAEVTASVADLNHRLAPHTTGGALLSLLPDAGLTSSAFTADDLRRLTEIKDRWDPDNLFGCGHTVPPSRSLHS